MRPKRLIFLMLLLPMLTAATAHKFYVSVSKIEYSEKDRSLQMITTLFADDLENTLKARYGDKVSLDPEKETQLDQQLLKEYILKKLQITVDGQVRELDYIGREYENDIVRVYIEVPEVEDPNKVAIHAAWLFELFEEQQNIIHMKKGDTRRSLVLEPDNPKGVLNFN